MMMEKTYCDREKEHALAVQRAKEGSLNGASVQSMSKVFRVLGDPTRMKLVLGLINGAMCVYHLAELTGASVSATSHQLRILREQNIVKTKRLGKNVEYTLADEHILEIVKLGISHLACEKGE